MTLKAKMFLYFLSLSFLIIIVGMIFYVQLKNLIGPLTPQSIPQSINQVVGFIQGDQRTQQIKYQLIFVENNLKDYVLTHQKIYLQRYYMNEALLEQEVENAKNMEPIQWGHLYQQLQIIKAERSKIVQAMANKQFDLAKKWMTDALYLKIIHQLEKTIADYRAHPMSANEKALITMRLAAQNSYRILQQNLSTTIVIFIDAVFISIIILFFIIRAINKPIHLLRNSIEEMDLKHFSIVVHPELLKQKGEVGDLARSFYDLFDKLRHAMVLRDELLAEIQQHKSTENKLQKTADILRETNIELNQFSYAASHDLRAPLRAIENLASWIEEDCYDILPKESRKNFDLIKQRAKRLNALISGLLEYSRAGLAEQEQEPLNLNVLIKEVMDTIAPPPSIHIMVENDMPTITANKAKLTQIYMNLIGNAIKYMDKPTGNIWIGHVLNDEYYHFFVKDNGPGIEAKYLERIFEIFQSIPSHPQVESTGIGLAIVKRIIKCYGGKIWVDSTVNQGSTFHFTWPR